MRKTLLLCVGIIAFGVARADIDLSKYPVLDFNTATEEQYRAVYNSIMSLTNEAEAAKIWRETKLYTVAKHKTLKHLAKEFDDGLSSKFTSGIVGYATYTPFFKLAVLNSKKNGIDEVYPKLVELRNKYRPYEARDAYHLTKAGVPLEEMIEGLNEVGLYLPDFKPTVFYPKHLKCYKKEIQKLASKNIKRKLRENGISFVVRNGVNPCEEYLTRLTAALDAPNFAGLNEWLSELGYKVQIDTSKFITSEQLEKVKNDVLYGDKDMDAKTTLSLLVGLGVDGYNQFVKEYNGEK